MRITLNVAQPKRVVNSAGSYVATRPNSRLRSLDREWTKSINRSEFLKREEAIKKMVFEMCGFLKLADNWNSYGAPAPQKEAVHKASLFVATLCVSQIFPIRAMPTSEGGIGLRFKRGARRALFEFLNTGHTNLILYEEDGSLEDTPDQLDEFVTIANVIERHLMR
jgi:hypothetical protein